MKQTNELVFWTLQMGDFAPYMNKVIKDFAIGYAPEGNLAVQEMLKAGYSEEVLTKVDVLNIVTLQKRYENGLIVERFYKIHCIQSFL
jgi:hypothetical protein